VPGSSPWPDSASGQQPPASLGKRLARLWPYFSRYRAGWVLAMAATVIGSLTEPAIPALLKPLLDRGFTQGQLPIWMPPVAIIGLMAIRGMAQFAQQYALSRITGEGMLILRRQLFERLLKAQLSLFTRRSSSELANTIVYEVQNGSQQLVHALLMLVRDGFTAVALLGYLIYLNWKLTLIVLVLLPCTAWIMKTLSRRLHAVTLQSQTATDELAYVVEENVLAHRMVRLHGAQTAQAARFDVLSRHLRELALRATRASAAITPLVHSVAAVSLSAVIAIALMQGHAAHSAGSQAVTVGGFAAFVGALLLLIAPIRRLADVVNPITRGLAALERGLDLLATVQPECGEAAPDSSAAAVPQRAHGAIALRGVRVAYRADGPAALDGIELDIRAGETVALVGPSGSGKTTLVNLLPRFVLPTAGQVELDGIDAAAWPLQTLRDQFALVSQDVTMFNDSIAANVALGAAQIDRDRVRRCLQAAHLADLVDTLPQGMDTVLGHNATQLSGGQRQRLAIARALYKDAPVLLLDEATSALDTESERLVQQAIDHAMAGRTTLVIAHRLSTIERANRIVVLEHGRIAEQGAHAALIAAGGLYARLARLQHGGYPGEHAPESAA
jgi:subfamily B ATP-binding cassette protein MsbA